MMNDTADSEPVTSATSVKTKPPNMKTTSQAKKYTAMAPKLRRQATKLKKSAFTGVTSCQCTKAGACQNIKDNGRYKIKAVQVAN